jgi:glycosyltransferase involved in cell wall biosynthesis
MQHADGIIFLSPAYINPVLNRFVPQTMRSEISKKISIIPNGVNDFWIEHSCFEPKVCKNNVKIIYVGDFSRNKNVLSVIKAVEELNTKYGNITLTLVGGGGKGSKMVMRKIEKSSPDVIKYHERTNDKQKLLKYYQESDIFVMASFKESFGIVYLEAMSQGLPIIYTKGQGIDGYFTEDIPGLAVDPNNIEDIKNNILFIKEHLTEMSQNALIHIKKFNWSLIALKYKKLYENIDTEKNL